MAGANPEGAQGLAGPSLLEPVALMATDVLLGGLLATALGERGRPVEPVAPGAPIEPGAIVVSIPPVSIGEFHSANWAATLAGIPTANPLVVIAEPHLPVRQVLVDRSQASGLGIIERAAASDLDELDAVVQLVASGRTVIDPSFEKANSQQSLPLSPAERAVLEYVVAGYSNRAIAATLYCSERTVESHVRRILARMGIVDDRSINRRVVLTRAVLDGRRAV